MGDFEMESKQLEAESWSRIVDSKFLKQQKKDVVKRQEVIYGKTLSPFALLILGLHCAAVFIRGIARPWKANFQVCSMSEIFFKNFEV